MRPLEGTLQQQRVYVQSRGLFALPCRLTLQKYVGKSAGEIRVTPLMKEHLRVEVEGLSVEQEQLCSLIIDEISIQQKVVYDRQIDKIFGLVDMGSEDGPEEYSATTPRVANRLLCFVLSGLSNRYVIQVGYIFARYLQDDQLYCMT